MKTVKVPKERKIADRTLLHLHGYDRSCRKADTSPCPCAQNNYGRRWERMRNAAHLRPKKALCFQCSWRNRAAAGNWRFLLPLSERYRIGVVAKRQHGVSRFDTRVTGTREEKRLLVGDGLIAR